MLSCIKPFITCRNVWFVFLFLQKELHFDNEFVLQQIRHTGILQMVHIQKSGYNAKYTFKVCDQLKIMLYIIHSMYINVLLSTCKGCTTEKKCSWEESLFAVVILSAWRQEFVEKFRILLPKGAKGTQEVITELFERMEMNSTTYQIGKSQVNGFYLIYNLFWS